MTIRTLLLTLLASTLLSTPALAQVDLSGTWGQVWHEDWQESVAGPDVGDFMGLALSADGRARASSFSASQWSEPERQCQFYTTFYFVNAPLGMRMSAESDPNTGATVSWHITGTLDRTPITIWMDGRPHPSPYAPHSTSGFTTGVWEGATLTTTTTHLAAGYLRRNGVPLSDQATMTMHFTRYGTLLSVVGIVEDPVYLTEPHVVSRTWQMNPNLNVASVGPPCVPEVELAAIKEGTVPHYLPGKNPFLDEMTRLYNIPAEATRGGAETMYPEFRKKLQDYRAPALCVRYCCSTAVGGCINNGGGPQGR